jgi:hypothetical protein
MAVFWVVALCSLVEIYWRFRGPWCLHHHLPDYTALQTRRHSSSYSPPWEPQILLNNSINLVYSCDNSQQRQLQPSTKNNSTKNKIIIINTAAVKNEGEGDTYNYWCKWNFMTTISKASKLLPGRHSTQDVHSGNRTHLEEDVIIVLH